MRVDSARLRRDLESLSRIGRSASGGINRTSYSSTDAEARRWYRQRCEEAGLELECDGLGNMFASAPGTNPREPSVWTGSHIDTVPDGGGFDGAVGTVAALECLRRLHEERTRSKRPVRAVIFTDEEGNYGHLLGSTGLAHGYDIDHLAGMTGRDGDRLLDALKACEWVSGSPAETRIDPRRVHAFVELHIEQGPRLETERIDIGVVTGIVGLGGGTLTFTGRADHAGTTPMGRRRDALSAAASFLVRIPELAARVDPDAVATCGIIRVRPGGANVVPAAAVLTLDFRSHRMTSLAALRDRLGEAAAVSADQYRCTVTWQPDPLVDSVELDPTVQDVIEAAAGERGLGSIRLQSGAGHDSQNMATLAPTGMIFVPSVGGRSHCPDERTDWRDIANGADVLLATVMTLANR